MSMFHVKRGDEVVVIAGADRGKRGKVIHISTGDQRAIVEGIHFIKKHTRKSQQHPKGAIVQREGTIHLSNLMLASQFDARQPAAAETSPPAS